MLFVDITLFRDKTIDFLYHNIFKWRAYRLFMNLVTSLKERVRTYFADGARYSKYLELDAALLSLTIDVARLTKGAIKKNKKILKMRYLHEEETSNPTSPNFTIYPQEITEDLQHLQIQFNGEIGRLRESYIHPPSYYLLASSTARRQYDLVRGKLEKFLRRVN